MNQLLYEKQDKNNNNNKSLEAGASDSDWPAVELLRVFLTHHVETSRYRRVDADREVVIDNVARYRVAFFVPVIVPVVVVAVGRRWMISAAVAVGNGRWRWLWWDGRQRRRSAELNVPAIQHHHRATCHAVYDLTKLLSFVTCHTSVNVSRCQFISKLHSANVQNLQVLLFTALLFTTNCLNSIAFKRHLRVLFCCVECSDWAQYNGDSPSQQKCWVANPTWLRQLWNSDGCKNCFCLLN